jgi:hypothetical protein
MELCPSRTSRFLTRKVAGTPDAPLWGPALDFLLLYLPSQYSFAHCSFIFPRVHFLFSPLFPHLTPHPIMTIPTAAPSNLRALLIIWPISISALLRTRPLSYIHLNHSGFLRVQTFEAIKWHSARNNST